MSEPSKLNIIPERGERALIVGRTGSGKTAFAIWLLQNIPDSPIIIYDTKIEPKFETLPHSIVVEDFADIHKIIDEAMHDYIIVRPGIHVLDNPEYLDGMLLWHYHHLQGFPAYIDEAYTFHSSSGRSGPGLVALLTRGRSKGITTIISSQRPVMISRMCITEAQKVYAFVLRDKKDRVRLDDIMEDFSKLPKPPKFHFFYLDLSDMETPILMAPVKLDAKTETGYTDDINQNVNNDPAKSANKSGLWL